MFVFLVKDAKIYHWGQARVIDGTYQRGQAPVIHILLNLLRSLKVDYPDAVILGHRDLPWVAKDCPCFSCATEYASLQPENR